MKWCSEAQFWCRLWVDHVVIRQHGLQNRFGLEIQRIILDRVQPGVEEIIARGIPEMRDFRTYARFFGAI